MIRLVASFSLVFCMALPLQARTVVLQSGDHDGFSRIVLEIGTPAPWQLGRTSDGYELKIQRNDLTFDVSRVFDLIPKSRIAAVWQDTETGTLQLNVACACHAIPFEFRPGVIVIDLKNGPPPKDSPFEASLAGSVTRDPEESAVSAPQPRPDVVLPWQNGEAAPSEAELPLPFASADLSPMRDALLRQLSDSAARGVVDMTVPPKMPEMPAKLPPKTQIRIGEDIGFVAGTRESVNSALAKIGETCIADDRLAIQDWGSDVAPAAYLADARMGLMGEFDAPNPEAVERAIRYLLNLGFGSEARELISTLAVQSQDREAWSSMARILDLEHAEQSAFSGMDGCDTAAAFWATMSTPEGTAANTINTKAVLRTFSGLPVHLRRHLGPGLANRLLADGDTASAEAVRAAVMRAPGESGPQVSLMGAAVAAAKGNVAEAEATLTDLASDSTTTVEPEALIALVDSLVQQGKPADPDISVTLDALAFEHRGAPLETELRRAHVLALASNGDFGAAFSALPNGPGAEAALMEMLGQQGPDSAILEHATLAANVPVPDIPRATRLVIADRLLALGFADPAAHWVGDIVLKPGSATEPERLLAANIAIAQKDARLTLRLLAGSGTQEAAVLRARAQAQLGDMSAAANTFLELGDTDARNRTLRLAQDWQALPESMDDPWRATADLIEPRDTALPTLPMPITLSNARNLLEDGESATSAINRLLSEVKGTPTP